MACNMTCNDPVIDWRESECGRPSLLDFSLACLSIPGSLASCGFGSQCPEFGPACRDWRSMVGYRLEELARHVVLPTEEGAATCFVARKHDYARPALRQECVGGFLVCHTQWKSNLVVLTGMTV